MNQNLAILEYLNQGNTITPIEGLKLFGTMRLGARIFDIKKMGYKIDTKLVGNDKHYAQYKLVPKVERQLVIPI